MNEEQLNERHGARLAEVFGENYREHAAYPRIVAEMATGTRTFPNVLSDFTESGERHGGGW